MRQLMTITKIPMRVLIWPLLMVCADMAYASKHTAENTCQQINHIEPVCGLSRPEDIVLLPGTKVLVLSQMGGFPDANPGTLAALSITNNKHRVIYPDPRPSAWEASSPSPLWGDPSCREAPGATLSPHGIDLTEHNGVMRLLVVNHGGRESIEFFELRHTSTAKEIDGLEVRWRGCVLAPQDALLNDVAATPEGGFVVSKMMSTEGAWWKHMFKAFLRLDTGYIWGWSADTGGSVLPGTAGSFPNGVAISADGRHLFINMYMSNEVIKVLRSNGAQVGVTSVRQPDNSSWDLSGGLLVASHRGGFIEQAACDGEHAPCDFAFEIVRIDPDTMRTEAVFAHEGSPMGAATVALDTGDWLYMGSYAGDRIIRIPHGNKAKP